MVNTWKNIHKNDSFGKKLKQYKNELKDNHYIFEFLEKYKGWKIYYDKNHNVFDVSLGAYGLCRKFKTKKTAKQFIDKHIDYDIDRLKSEILS